MSSGHVRSVNKRRNDTYFFAICDWLVEYRTTFLEANDVFLPRKPENALWRFSRWWSSVSWSSWQLKEHHLLLLRHHRPWWAIKTILILLLFLWHRSKLNNNQLHTIKIFIIIIHSIIYSSIHPSTHPPIHPSIHPPIINKYKNEDQLFHLPALYCRHGDSLSVPTGQSSHHQSTPPESGMGRTVYLQVSHAERGTYCLVGRCLVEFEFFDVLVDWLVGWWCFLFEYIFQRHK